MRREDQDKPKSAECILRESVGNANTIGPTTAMRLVAEIDALRASLAEAQKQLGRTRIMYVCGMCQGETPKISVTPRPSPQATPSCGGCGEPGCVCVGDVGKPQATPKPKLCPTCHDEEAPVYGCPDCPVPKPQAMTGKECVSPCNCGNPLCTETL